jgi:adenylate cyclase
MAQRVTGEGGNEELHLFFTGKHPGLETARRWMMRLPSGREPRCNVCYAPFGGLGHALIRRRGFVPWDKNPNICKRCILELGSSEVRGTEIELSLLFADIRGSTELAGRMSPAEFSALMNRFYAASTAALLDSDALIDKFVGDEAIGIYIPVVAGEEHARKAISAGVALLDATGHPHDPWVPLGVGVHTGNAFLGVIGEGEVTDFTALGDAVNLAARLGGAAARGEVLVSDQARDAAGLTDRFERRTLELKGVGATVDVAVLHAGEVLSPA